MAQELVQKSYATFGINRSLRQMRFAYKNRQTASNDLSFLLKQIKTHESRMSNLIDRPIQDMQILEIGPGQGLERAHYFGIDNEVTGLDLDVIPIGIDIPAYLHMFRNNGLGRVAKTLGRKLIIGSVNDKVWRKLIGVERMRDPKMIYGDICNSVPGTQPFDVVMSWSVFEHLPHPEQALQNVIKALQPGGLFYISLHLFSSHDGHHDIRAFTGAADDLPLWGHLSEATADQFHPSAYCNEWRLSQWRELFADLAPGYTEHLEMFDTREIIGSQLSAQRRDELKEYSDEELYTVNAIYMWQKPQG